MAILIDPLTWDDVGDSDKSMGELGDLWWISAYGTPDDSSPLTQDDSTDPLGRRGTVERHIEFNRNSPEGVFFVVGALENGEYKRTIVVGGDDEDDDGDDRSVLVGPTVNGASPSGVDNPPGEFPTEEETREGISGSLDIIPANSTVTVEGQETVVFTSENSPLPPPGEQNEGSRRSSPPGGFTYELVEGNPFGRPAQTVSPAVADGYWFAIDLHTESSDGGDDDDGDDDGGGDLTVNFTGFLDLTELGLEEPLDLNVTYNILNPVFGTDEGEEILGTDFNDYIVGDNGKDSITGLDGNDLILGDNGDDIIDGGSGSDELWGDDGIDTFIYKKGYGEDTIFDFAEGETVKIEGFESFTQTVIDEMESENGISAVEVVFDDGNNGDVLTFSNLEKELNINLDEGKITI